MIILSILLLTSAAATLGAIVAEPLDGTTDAWAKSQHTTPDNADDIQIHIALQYQNLHRLEAELAAVSTPGSPRYGQYFDANSVHSMFAPSKDSASKVENWLQRHNARNIVSSNGTVSFTTSVGQADSMFNTISQHDTNGPSTKLRTTAYSVPHELGEHVGAIYPTTPFGDTKSKIPAMPSTTIPERLTKRQSEDCTTMTIFSPKRQREFLVFCPHGIRKLYNTADYTPDPHSGSDVAFANFLNETPSYADLEVFEETFGLPAQNFTTLAILEGAVDGQDPQTQKDFEGNLDVQYIMTVAQGLPVYSYLTGGLAPFLPTTVQPDAATNANEPYLQFFEHLLFQTNEDLPHVVSISYGDDENSVPPEYAAHVCNQVGMLGLRGRTIITASGDQGVGTACRARSPDGSTNGKPQFTPEFPTSCPYITSVGGTVGGALPHMPESAWNLSGSGFSSYFPMPWYQKKDVSGYLQNHMTSGIKDEYSNKGYVNFSGRAFPDIAAHSDNPRYFVTINGTGDAIYGTSGAAPVVAGVIALLNDVRFRAGKPAMGFINPWLYSAGRDALTDITTGGASGCNAYYPMGGRNVPGAAIIPYAGFNASTGWDPATGLGTPDFEKMRKAALDVFDWHGVPKDVWDYPPAGGWGWHG